MNYAIQFSENKLMETYTKFINNFMQAKSNIQIAKEQLPMFAKFLGVGFVRLNTATVFMCNFNRVHLVRVRINYRSVIY